MTTLGHMIVGATIGTIWIPSSQRSWRTLCYMVAIIAVANIPDWPLPGWGHHRLSFSHSIFVNMVAMTCIIVIWMRWAGLSAIRRYRNVMMAGTLAWLSHFLLDTLYVDSGLRMLWPLSNEAVSLPIPWLRTMPHVPPPFDQQILQILGLELITFSPLLIIALFVGKRFTVSGTNYI
jgi:hypothetical protein